MWDSDGDRLTVGTGAGRKTLLNGEDADGADIFIFRYPGPVVEACLLRTSRLWRSRDPGEAGGSTGSTDLHGVDPMSSGYSPLIDEHRWA